MIFTKDDLVNFFKYPTPPEKASYSNRYNVKKKVDEFSNYQLKVLYEVYCEENDAVFNPDRDYRKVISLQLSNSDLMIHILSLDGFCNAIQDEFGIEFHYYGDNDDFIDYEYFDVINHICDELNIYYRN